MDTLSAIIHQILHLCGSLEDRSLELNHRQYKIQCCKENKNVPSLESEYFNCWLLHNKVQAHRIL